MGSRSEVTLLNGADLSVNGERLETKTDGLLDIIGYDEELEENIYDTENPYQLHTIRNASGVVASKSKRYYKTFDWGKRLVKKIEGIDSAIPITTTFVYGTSPTGAPESYGQVIEVNVSDGYKALYEYHADNLRGGELKREIRPYQHTLPHVDTQSGNVDGEVTTYDYTADWTGRNVLRSSVIQSYRLLDDNGGLVSSGTTSKKTSTIGTSSSANGQPLNTVAAQSYSGETNYETSDIAYFRRHLWDTVYVHLLYSERRSDGRKTSYAYHKGDYNSSTNVFTVNESYGEAWRETALHGWHTEPGGSEELTELDSQTIAVIRLVSNKSTKEVIYRNTKANVVRTESCVFTGGTSWEILGWINYVYDDASRLISTTNHKGEVVTIEWTDGRKTAEIDATGIRTEYTYDALNRVLTARKKGIAAAGGFPAQADIVTTFTYDALGRVLTKTVADGTLSLASSSQFDLAGRLTQSADPDTGTTTHSYANDGRTQTSTFSDASTKITDRYRDRRVKDITGTAVVAQYFSYAGLTETIRYGASVSVRYRTTARDWLGRTTSAKPNSQYERTSTYNSFGQLIESRDGVAPAVPVAYNTLGEPYRTGLGAGGDPAYTGNPVSEAEERFEKDGSHWWHVKRDKVYSVPMSSTLITTAATKTRLTGFAANVVEETKIIDVHGNTTTRTVEVDRTAKKVVTRTAFPDSSVSEEVTAINGLSFRRRTKENLTFESRYDGLGRVVQEIDPRTGTSSIAYQTGTSRVASRTNAAGKTTIYTYDSMGRVLTEQNPAGKYTRYAYTSRGELWHTWGDTTYPVEYTYDNLGQKTHMRTYRGGTGWNGATWPASPGTADVTQWTYQVATGYVASKIYPTGNTVQYAYDTNGQLTTKTNARGQSITYGYTYNYGAPLLTSRVSYASGASLSETYSHNRIGRPSGISDSIGSYTPSYALTTNLSLTYTDLSGLHGSRRITPKYATTGVVGRNIGFQLGTSSAPAADEDITYGYDAYGRLKSVGASFAGGAVRTVDYGYLANSNLLSTISQASAGFAMTRLYEANRDLMTTTSAAIGSTVKAAYTYAYDDLGRRTSVIETGEIFNGYASVNPGLVEKYTYNDRSELLTAKTYVGNSLSSTTVLPGRDYGYAFDSIGNRISTTTNGRPAVSYTTNANNQYTARAVPGVLDVAGEADAAATVVVNSVTLTSGDRSHQYYHHATPFSPTTAPMYATVTVDDGVPPAKVSQKLLPMPSEVMTYDADGNLTSNGQWNYTWDAVNRLTKMETRTEVVNIGVPKQKLEFAYDYMDRRVQKKVYAWVTGNWSLTSDTRFIYDGWNVIAEYNGVTSTVSKRYAWGIDFSGSTQGAGGVGGLLMAAEGTATHLAVHDGRGNVTALVNAADGSVSATYEYDPFGRTLRGTGSYAVSNPFRFSSKFTDDETGLVYYGRRYYSPSQGRFLGRDPKEEGGGLNLYGFCRNNSINLWDYLGMEFAVVPIQGPDGTTSYQIWNTGDGYDAPVVLDGTFSSLQAANAAAHELSVLATTPTASFDSDAQAIINAWSAFVGPGDVWVNPAVQSGALSNVGGASASAGQSGQPSGGTTVTINGLTYNLTLNAGGVVSGQTTVGPMTVAATLSIGNITFPISGGPTTINIGSGSGNAAVTFSGSLSGTVAITNYSGSLTVGTAVTSQIAATAGINMTGSSASATLTNLSGGGSFSSAPQGFVVTYYGPAESASQVINNVVSSATVNVGQQIGQAIANATIDGSANVNLQITLTIANGLLSGNIGGVTITPNVPAGTLPGGP